MNHSTETLDALFDGRITLFQSRAGYRFSLDALLLAYFAAIKPKEKVADLGAGSGVVALIVAGLHPSCAITGIELQSAMADRARRNVRLNGLEDRIKMIQADVRGVGDVLGAGTFDAAICNPPYRKPSSGRISENAERRVARHETHGGVQEFLRAGAYLLRHKGRMALCYPAIRLTDLIAALRQVRIEPKRLRMVHSFPGSEAVLVLIEGVKGGRAGLAVAQPLIIYDKGKSYGEEVASMIAGLPKASCKSTSEPLNGGKS